MNLGIILRGMSPKGLRGIEYSLNEKGVQGGPPPEICVNWELHTCISMMTAIVFHISAPSVLCFKLFYHNKSHAGEGGMYPFHTVKAMSNYS